MLSKLKDYLIPHTGNNFRPKLFAVETIGVLVLFLILFQVTFVTHTAVIRNSDFFAAVLPSVLVMMTNADRANAGVLTLETDALLAKAAQAKADDMAINGYFAHVDPSGRQPWYWLDKVGYLYSYAGENLAMDFLESVDVESAWMNSPAHKANIVKDKFTNIGIGVARGIYQGRETIFVVQFFATPVTNLDVKPLSTPIENMPKAQDVNIAVEPLRDSDNIVIDNQAEDEKVLGAVTDVEKAQNITSKTDIVVSTTQTPYSVSGSVFMLKNIFAKIATSPSTWFMPLLVTLFAVLCGTLAISLVMYMNKSEVKGIALAISMLLILTWVVFFNFGNSTSAQVPNDAQYASVIHAI